MEECRCGDCCKLTIRISDSDINRIEKAGIDLTEKLAKDKDGTTLLGKKADGYCHFLEFDEKIAICSIYEKRPKVCRAFECAPFKRFSKNLNLITLQDPKRVSKPKPFFFSSTKKL